MKKTIFKNINIPYSLHDMNVDAFELQGNDLIMKTQTGIIEVEYPSKQVDGYLIFKDVQLDFSYVYLLGVTGNEGTFTGHKMFLKDFIEKYDTFGFSVMDETYGYNQAKYSGYLLSHHEHHECIIEIYHEGDLIFVEE